VNKGYVIKSSAIQQVIFAYLFYKFDRMIKRL